MSTQFGTLGQFVPFQERIPLWITGPVIVEQMVPERLVMVARGDGIWQDTAWVDMLWAMCPPEDREALCQMWREADASPFMSGYTEELQLEHFMNRLCNAALLCQINSRVRDVDAMRTAQRRPTWRDGVLHLSGVRPFYGDPT